MIKQFIKQCMFFQSKEQLHKVLGIFVWLNIIQLILAILRILHNLSII